MFMFFFEKTGQKICIERNCIFHCDVAENFRNKFQMTKAVSELQNYFMLKSYPNLLTFTFYSKVG